MVRAARQAFLVASMLLPSAMKCFLYRRLLGWEIAPGATIGVSYISASRVRLEHGSRIGHFNVIRGLPVLQLAANATIGQWNWMSCAKTFVDTDRRVGQGPFRGLMVGAESAITSRHYLDCSGGIVIEEFVTVGGVRSTILSHEIDLSRGVQTTASVRIGHHSFISSNVSVSAGARVAARSVVAMGAVVVGVLETEGALYAGVPARIIRSSIDAGKYFHRTRGFVGLTSPDTALDNEQPGPSAEQS